MTKIKKARLAQGINQIQLAEKAEIAQAYLSEIETGKAIPSIHVYRRLSKALGVPMTELLDDEPNANKKISQEVV